MLSENSQNHGIQVEDLKKHFVLRSPRKSWFPGRRRNDDEIITAVDGISFDIQPREIVGFLGPNGAGKTTTLKMLSGLLHPTAGTLRLDGHVPSQRSRTFLRSIAFVMGQRQQLVWDVPVRDSFELNRTVYGISPAEYERSKSEIVDLLELGPLLGQTARTLSLGQRMRCEIAASLLHSPRIVFLDEPTLGLDVPMQRRIRSFIKEYNRRRETTVLLTSHYMADISELCRRTIVIHHGSLIYDGSLDTLVQTHAPFKRIIVKLREEGFDLSTLGEVIRADGAEITLKVAADRAPETVLSLLERDGVLDLQIMDASLDDVIEQLFTQAATR